MTDIHHVMGSDLTIAPVGDILSASAGDAVAQRVLRRLLTNAGDYIWSLPYGAGLPQFVGRTVNVTQLPAVIRNQLQLEASVARVPLPSATVTSAADGTVVATITYTDASTGTVQQPSVVLGASSP